MRFAGTALVKRGYTVLTFDFYGHGGTPWPEYDRYIVADLDLFLEQTEELLVRTPPVSFPCRCSLSLSFTRASSPCLRADPPGLPHKGRR
jgi:alpha-beta hydrolase superfamily lysophospholipase